MIIIALAEAPELARSQAIKEARDSCSDSRLGISSVC